MAANHLNPKLQLNSRKRRSYALAAGCWRSATRCQYRVTDRQIELDRSGIMIAVPLPNFSEPPAAPRPLGSRGVKSPTESKHVEPRMERWRTGVQTPPPPITRGSDNLRVFLGELRAAWVPPPVLGFPAAETPCFQRFWLRICLYSLFGLRVGAVLAPRKINNLRAAVHRQPRPPFRHQTP